MLLMYPNKFPARRPMPPLRTLALSAAIGGALLAPPVHCIAGTEDDEFDPAFFAGTGINDAIIARFSRGDVIPDGSYAVTVSVNGERKHEGLLTFSGGSGERSAQPCLSDAMLASYGVRPDAIHAPLTDPASSGADAACMPLVNRIAGASSVFDIRTLALDLRIPNASMTRTLRGTIRPEDMDTGVDVGMLTYRASSFTTRNSAGALSSQYLGLDAGANLGHWRLRHAGTYRMSNGKSTYATISTRAERPLPRLGASITVGEHYTSDSQLDSVRVSGITLSSDTRMLPDAASGYAPIVRGIAETNALVRVTQRGVTLSETQVSPGAFAIDDLNPTGYGGDLHVEIIESDGRMRSFNVPYSSTPELLREGQRRFRITAGRFDEPLVAYRPWLAQGSLAHGLTNAMTAYTSGTAANGYLSLQLGVARNTSVGAVSFDVTGTQARMTPLHTPSGYQLQARFSKNFAEHGTTLALGASRYSTEGYLGVSDAFEAMQSAQNTGVPASIPRLRGRLDLALNKSLGRFGSINLSGSSQDYWGALGRSTSLVTSYNTALGQATLGVSAMRSLVHAQDRIKRETNLHLSLAMPLGAAPKSPRASVAVEHRDGVSIGHRMGLSGRLGEKHPITYAASLTQGAGRDPQISASVAHSSGIAEVQGSVSRSAQMRTASWGVTGGLVVHREGLTFAPPLGDTIALVSAPGAHGARIGHGTTRIGRNGFGVVPHLTPYRMNAINIDPAESSMDVQFSSTSSTRAPTAGAAVRVAFDSTAARATLIETTVPGGMHLPFGADVLDLAGQSIGLVGQSGRIFIQREAELSEGRVNWGDSNSMQCHVTLPADTSLQARRPYTTAHATCTPVPTSPSAPVQRTSAPLQHSRPTLPGRSPVRTISVRRSSAATPSRTIGTRRPVLDARTAHQHRHRISA